MDVESVLYGLIAGAIIVLLAMSAGYRSTPRQRMQGLGLFMVAGFLFAVLTLAGVGGSFAIIALVAAVALLMCGAVRHLIVRQPR